MSEVDVVNQPKHYNQIKVMIQGIYYKIEAHQVISSLAKRLPGSESWLFANVFKYLWRYPDKNGVEDLKKARWYLDKLIEAYEETHK